MFVDLHDERPEPNWNALADAGCLGAYLKLGEGTSRVGGELAPERANRCRSAGLFAGFYWFARPDTGQSPAQEAAAFSTALAGVEMSSDWRPVLDLERGMPKDATNPATAGRWGADVLLGLGSRGHHRTAWYASASPAGAMTPLHAWPAWIAAYGPNDGAVHPIEPVPSGVQILAHQYTSAGHVADFTGDCSVFTSGRIARMLAQR